MDKIKMGKNIIDNLTTGMYEDSKIIYREYIQNSTDAIDKAIKSGLFTQDEKPFIDIQIEQENRIIRIEDNATGIAKANIHNKLANIADSDKVKGVEKGFRGIGRLGGLAYCDELRFITTFKGESVKTTMIWNAKECRRLVQDSTVNESAEEIFKKVISYKEEDCKDNEHFFIVELHNISIDNNDLLNEEEVRKYIQWNAPVSYNRKFIYASKIKDYIKKIGVNICEYNIQVEGEDIHKDYGTILYEKPSQSKQKSKYDEIYDLEFKEFKNEKGELLAWIWYGISAFNKQIPQVNEMRGIRLRKDNIQIGNSETLIKLFRESRGNYYFIGEVHAIHKDLLPNARRDYFNENNTRNEFEAKLGYYFKGVLHRLYNEANKTKNALKRELEYKQEVLKYKELNESGFIDEKEKEKVESNLENAQSEWEKGKKSFESVKENSKGNSALEKVISLMEEKHQEQLEKLNLSEPDKIKKVSDNDEKNKHKSGKKGEKNLISSGLNKLNREERKLVSKIYSIINDVLPYDVSRNLVQKIQEELNK